MSEEMLNLNDFKRDYLDKHLRFVAEPASVKADLYAEVPEKVAFRIGMHKTLDRRTQTQTIMAKKENKPTQLRRFYDEITHWHEKARQKPEDFPAFLPLIKMLKAKVAYAKSRGHVDGDYETLVRHCIDQVDSPIKLNQCKTFFEAFMGFYKATRPKD
ncbi:MAG: type III-A CRISPR-associated protein Csm2 [Gammaproteobacteria bacterium]|nr:type III-A CRISPR-associated protein Csm2 [Gammaproteobacteria bacterium]